MFWFIIIILEILFWFAMALFAGARYWWQRPGWAHVSIGTAVLLSAAQIPVAVWDWGQHGRITILHIDVFLDLIEAALLLGGIAIFGRSWIRRIDQRLAIRMDSIRVQRLAGAGWLSAIDEGWDVEISPKRAPETGDQRAKRERTNWVFHALLYAAAISSFWFFRVTGLQRLLPPWDTIGLPFSVQWILRSWGMIFVIDTVWSWSYTFWPERTSKTLSPGREPEPSMIESSHSQNRTGIEQS